LDRKIFSLLFRRIIVGFITNLGKKTRESLRRISVDGGETKRLEGLPKEKFHNFAFSKDGKQLAFVRGQEIRDVVLFRRSKD
jgi:hypothetical protein